MNTPAMIIDFEATDVSKEAEATQLGWRNVRFNKQGSLCADLDHLPSAPRSLSILCTPDRTISYGAMAVSHITMDDLKGTYNHKDLIPTLLPEGEAYIIGHNVDYDIQVAANAGADVSQYKRICTQALARRLIPDTDSHALGALMYYLFPERAKQYCRNAHDAGYDVTFTLWLLEHLCELGGITNMQDLHNASEEARIPLTFTFGKHQGKTIKDIAVTDRSYLQWIIKNHDNAYLVKACLDAITRNININV